MTPGNLLQPWQRRLLVLAAAALAATGVAWLPVHWLWGAGAGELPHPAEPWLMRAHGLFALVGLFAAGVVSAGHVERGWRLGRQRATGVLLCALLALLAGTGYALWYLASEAARPAVGWIHAGAGVVACVIGVAHARWRRAGAPVVALRAPP